MTDKRIAGTLFIDMKYIFLYHKIGFREVSPDTYVKDYDEINIIIKSEDQFFIVNGEKYPLTHHRDFVILELLDLLLSKGYGVGEIIIRDDAVILDGVKRITLRCEQWGNDYEESLRGAELSCGTGVYASRLSGGLIERKYTINVDGNIQTSGLYENESLYDFSPLEKSEHIECLPEFRVNDDVLVEYMGGDDNVIIPRGIRKIETGAFWNNTSVRTIVIPDTVTVIGGDAFVYCYNLRSVNVPSSVVDMGDDPFAGCPNLILTNDSDEFVIEKGVLFTKDRTRLIHYTPSLSNDSYEIPDSVLWIGKHSFYNCNNLRTVVIGKNVDYIGNNAFSDCHNIVLVNNSPNFVYQDGALLNREKTIIIHYSHGRDADEYDMPDSVKTVGRNSFWNCKRIRKIRLGKGLRQIGYNPFANCSNLVIESDSPNYVVIDGILYDSGVREIICCTDAVAKAPIILPDTVENIGRNSFAGCVSLKDIKISNSVRAISRGAFSNCDSLEYVFIPDSVEIVEKWAFSYCTSLKKVSISKSTELSPNTFTGSPNVCVEYR